MGRTAFYLTLVICLIFSVLTTGAIAQDNDSSMAALLTDQRLFPCSDYSYNANLLMPQLYERGELDSVLAVLEFVEGQCYENGLNAWWGDRYWSHFPDKLLLLIQLGRFDESLYDQGMIRHLVSFRQSAFDSSRVFADTAEIEVVTVHYTKWVAHHTRRQRAQTAHDAWLYRMAAEIATEYPEDSLQHLLARFYMRDYAYFFSQLRSPAFADTDLRRYLDQFVAEEVSARSSFNFFIEFYGGAWIPFFAEDLIGVQPELGGGFGLELGRWRYRLFFTAQLFDAKRAYYADQEGQQDLTREFRGMMFGVEAGRRLYTGRRYSLEASAGLGATSVETFHRAENHSTVSHSSFAVYLGATQRLRMSQRHNNYLSLTTRVAFSDHSFEGGSDLSGPTFSILLGLGWNSIDDGHDNLVAVDYRE